ncbi:hypothetical protein CF327_g6149 [Tilletia walkeri]|nr:hypothetical protein CF327_g6149 [Tilletia walkeri]
MTSDASSQAKVAALKAEATTSCTSTLGPSASASASASVSSSAQHGALPTREPGSALVDPDDSTILPLDSFPETGTPEHPKLSSWELYASLGSPQRIVAPMVDQSELAWRILSRRYGADLVYTPMINAGMFVTAITASEKGKGKGKGRRFLDDNFDLGSGEEGAELIQLLGREHQGKRDTDLPLVVQFCANDPDILLRAAQYVETQCSAIDLNLGCPQGIAKRGRYGAFLQEDWPLIFRLVNKLHLHSRAPVTAKMRIFPSLARTISYARMLERAGAQILTVHGRTREMKGHFTGLADWEAIRAVKRSVKIPVFANGNVQYPADFELAMRRTGADGIMSAEGNLYNPAIFLPSSSPLLQKPSSAFPLAPEFPFPGIISLAKEYLNIVRGLRTHTGSSAIKAHLFKICRPALEVHKDLRELLGRSHLPRSDEPRSSCQPEDEQAELERREKALVNFRDFVRLLEERLDEDSRGGLEAFRTKMESEGGDAVPCGRKLIPLASASPYYSASVDGLAVDEGNAAVLITAEDNDDQSEVHLRQTRIPHWLAQPYFRPELPPEHFQKINELNALQKLAAAKAKRERTEKANDDDDGDDERANGGQVTAARKAGEGGSVGGDLPHAKRLRLILEEATELKDEGNKHFLAKRPEEALASYEDALGVLPPQPRREGSENGDGGEAEEGKEEEEVIASSGVLAAVEAVEGECAKLRATLYANVAACQLAFEQWDLAIKACSFALVDDPNYVKALYRRATAYEKKGGWVALSNAEQDYKTIQGIPETPRTLLSTVETHLQRLHPLVEEAGQKEKEAMMGQLKGMGNTVLGYFGLSTDNFKFEQQPGGGYSMNFVK